MKLKTNKDGTLNKSSKRFVLKKMQEALDNTTDYAKGYFPYLCDLFYEICKDIHPDSLDIFPELAQQIRKFVRDTNGGIYIHPMRDGKEKAILIRKEVTQKVKTLVR